MNYSLIKSHTVDEVSHLSLNFIVQQLISERYEVKKKIVTVFSVVFTSHNRRGIL